LNWFGVPDLTTWNKMTLAEKTPHHEKFARGFEAYLRSGKAPNEKLQGIFAQVKEWLTGIYQKLTDLNVKLTPEVREVMDRMLATKEGENVKSAKPDNKTAASAVLSDPKANVQAKARARKTLTAETAQGKGKPGTLTKTKGKEKPEGDAPLYSRRQAQGGEKEKTLWREARDWALGKLRKDYKNPVTVKSKDGDSIIVSYRGFRHALENGVPTPEKTAMALHIEEAIAAAERGETKPDKLGRADPSSVTTYHTDAVIDGQQYGVDIVVRNHADGSRYYDHFTMEKARQGDKAGRSKSTSPILPSNGLSISIDEIEAGGKEDGNFSMRDRDATDQWGEDGEYPSEWDADEDVTQEDLAEDSRRRVAAVTAEIDKSLGAGTAERLQQAGLLVIHEKPSGLPADTKDAQGFFDPKTGKIHLIAANIAQGKGAALLEHEGWHRFLDGMKDTPAHTRLMNRLRLIEKAAKNGQAEKWFQQAAERIPGSDKTNESRRLNELAAYAIEQYESAPRSLPQAVAKWVQDFIANVKTWMEANLGFTPETLTAADLAAVSRRFLRQQAAGERGIITFPATDQFAEAGNMVPQGLASTRDRLAEAGNMVPEAAYSLPDPESKSFRQTEKAYGGQQAYDQAQKAGRTKLNYRQWVQVRTPEFKNWFGEHELAALDKTMRRVRGSDQAKAVRDEIVGKPLTNVETGTVATVSGESFRKMMSASNVERSVSSQAHFQALGNIDTLFRLATLEQTREGKKPNDAQSIDAIRHFVVPMPFAGGILQVRILAKEFRQSEQGNRLYLVEAVEIEDGVTPASLRGTAVEGGGVSGEKRTPSRPAGVTDRFAQMVAAVKGEDVSKVIDEETGEPRVVYHGTGEDFNVFHTGKTDKQVLGNRTSAWGSSFSAKQKTAKAYAEIAPGPSEVVKAMFLNLRNPYEMSYKEWQKHSYAAAKMSTQNEGREFARAIRRQIESKGFDGIVIWPEVTNEFVAFSPNQIKSATANTGAFSAENDDIRYSQSAMKDIAANIRRGREALSKAITGKTDAHRAMFRNGLGWVDFVWGSEGTIKSSGKTKGAMGLSHIIEARMRKDGMNRIQAIRFLHDVVDTIAEGSEIPDSRKEVDGVVRVGVQTEKAVVWMVRNPGNNAWVVTGYEPNKNPDGRTAGRATDTPTNAAASLTRGDDGAGFDKSLAPNEAESKIELEYAPPGNSRGQEGMNPSRRPTTDTRRTVSIADFLKNAIREDGKPFSREGRAQPLTAKILTPSGYRLMSDIHVGGEVVAVDGSATEVLDVYPQGKMDIYRVTLSDGSSTRATDDHLWSVCDEEFGYFEVMTTKEIMLGMAAGRRYEIHPLEGNMAALANRDKTDGAFYE
jgi:hypothetical protein